MGLVFNRRDAGYNKMQATRCRLQDAGYIQVMQVMQATSDAYDSTLAFHSREMQSLRLSSLLQSLEASSKYSPSVCPLFRRSKV